MTVGRASRLQGLDAFVEAVEAGGFAAAAERLGITRSAVAKAVARLETALGTRLLIRSTRSLQLTAEGQLFFERAAPALQALDEAELALSARRDRVAGPLAVSVPMSFGRRWVLPALLDFAEDHPGLRLDVGFTDRFVRLEEEGVDLAVRIGGTAGTGGESGGLVGRTLASQTAHLCAAPGYVGRFGRPETIADLTDHRCINYVRDGQVLPWRLRDAAGRVTAVRPPGPHSISHGEAMRDAVLAGYGIARLPTWLIADCLDAGTLLVLLPATAVEEQPIRLLWPARRTRHPRVRRAIDALVARFTPMAPWEAA